MPYDLFWEGSASAIWHYINKGEREQKEQTDLLNFGAYLQGQYIYTALLCASPLLHAFAPKGTKAHDYPDMPFELHQPEQEKEYSEKLIAEKNALMVYFKMKMLETDARAIEKIEGAEKQNG